MLAALLLLLVSVLGSSPAPAVSRTMLEVSQLKRPQPKLTTETSVRPKAIQQKRPQPKSIIETSVRPKVSESDQPAPTEPIGEIDSGHSHAILAWNVESGGNDPRTIAKQLKQLYGYDVYCLCEVRPDSLPLYASAFGEDFHAVESSSGGGDRQLILIDRRKFKLIKHFEVHKLNRGNHRAPLLVFLQDLETGKHLAIIANHLARGDKKLRQKQAAGLRELVRGLDVGMVAIGDFNMDFSFRRMQGNPAFTEMVRDNIWKWVAPEPLVDTQWSDNNGKDRYPNSMLDFAFVAGPAKDWQPKCRVIVRLGDFPDNSSTSDHRPVELRLKLK